MLRIIQATTPQPNHILQITYADGEVVLVDFKPIIAEGGVFAPLADPQFFAQVSVAPRGRFIQWPGEIDFCADALWLEGEHHGALGLQIANSS